ncbi:hypothetical protein KJ751_01850 [Patescibacteria group bacterium]|nr:hypothetical protein [Patescibacteria group bacterium]
MNFKKIGATPIFFLRPDHEDGCDTKNGSFEVDFSSVDCILSSVMNIVPKHQNENRNASSFLALSLRFAEEYFNEQ